MFFFFHCHRHYRALPSFPTRRSSDLRLNPKLAVEGIVLTMFDGRTSLALQIREEVHRYFPGEIFDTVIPRNVRLTEAPSYGKPVMLHDLRSSGSVAYLELAGEVLKHE